MRRLIAILAFLAFVPSAQAGTPVAGFNDTALVSGLSSPTAIAFLPNGKLLLTEQGGALKLIQGTSATTITNISVCSGSEMGLLGVAVDPSWTTNGFVYLYRTKPSASGCASATGRFNQVVRITMSGDTVLPGAPAELLTGIRTDGGNHNGGGLRIGPDNKLYVSVGDTGIGDGGPPGASTNPYSQDLNALEGKVLRLELDGSPAAGNPYIGQVGKRGEIWASGFRNPFRFGFDPQTGSLWLGDVGQNTVEELDIVVAGGDYAWPKCEGTLPTGCQANVPGPEPVVDPIFQYYQPGTGIDPSLELGSTVIGGAFAPAGFGNFGGQYFFADYVSSKIYRGVPNAARNDLVGTPSDFVTSAAGPVDLVFAPNGTGLYYVAINTGQLRKVAPTYPRPVGASKLRVTLLPAFDPCTAPTTQHGQPLDRGSCQPATPSSDHLTVPSAGSRSNSSLLLNVICTNAEAPPCPASGEQEDVTIVASATDVRRISSSEYTGELEARLSLRMTDRYNGPTLQDGATVSDATLSFTVPCTTTPDTTLGGSCQANTSVNTVVPGLVKESQRAIYDLGQAQFFDGGLDDDAATVADNTLFLDQGIFAP
jgi:glucose/arabinose dehydrogenase